MFLCYLLCVFMYMINVRDDVSKDVYIYDNYVMCPWIGIILRYANLIHCEMIPNIV